MATIDCTLNALKVPGFSGYTPPFGTKITGSITPRDANNNVLAPFGFQRPKTVTETSTTTQIQAHSVFEIVAGGITLTLGNAAFTGCRVAVINSANSDATVKSASSPSMSITARAHESVHFEWVNGMWVVVNERAEFVDMIAYALDLGGRAHQESKKTVDQRIQTGIATIINRGVIAGITVEKSTTALRNISVLAGKFFMNGMESVCPAFPNSALVPDNYGNVTRYCYAYLYFNSGSIRFACTPLDGLVPDNGMALYRFSVPAGNSYQNDPYLNAVTMTDVRRVEAAYPVQFNSVAYVSVALPFNLLDAEYTVQLEILDYKGGYNQWPIIHADNKAANGFNLKAEGTLDAVRVRWTVFKPTL
ncbi:MAG: hypothetical protein LBB62_03600 [Proteiniphilum sp.]|jgi:hypothetical protein|nr:hypothetical protein [Proteiniphilum sp.]